MKIDRYLKIVLTIITINLTLMTLKDLDFFPKAYAENPNIPSIGKMNYGLVPINKDGSIEVIIKSISSDSKIDVNIEEVGGWSTNGGNLEVVIQNQPIEAKIVD